MPNYEMSKKCQKETHKTLNDVFNIFSLFIFIKNVESQNVKRKNVENDAGLSAGSSSQTFAHTLLFYCRSLHVVSFSTFCAFNVFLTKLCRRFVIWHYAIRHFPNYLINFLFTLNKILSQFFCIFSISKVLRE